MKLLHGDVLSFARHYKGEPFHALLCDAPYHLTSTTERYGKEGAAEATTPVFARAARGFMGKSWDGGDISFRSETWKALGNLLYPGAFGMTFGGSRTAHRMAVAIEDAGMIIHPMIGWVYGSGFPKATRIDTQIQSKEEMKSNPINKPGIKTGASNYKDNVAWSGNNPIATDEDAQIWEGHRYGLQALKPALEPIIVFQKPYEGRPVDSITKTGAGALNIDGGRIGVGSEVINEPQSDPSKREGIVGKHLFSPNTDKDKFQNAQRKSIENMRNKGRWPSNFVLTHSPDCEQIGYRDDSYQINRFTDGAKPFGDGAGHEFESEEMESGTPVWDCVEGCPVKELDRQSGVLKSGGIRMASYSNENDGIFTPGGKQQSPFYGSSGGASRFFHQSFYYQAKAGVRERNAGLGGFDATFSPTMGDGIGGKEHNPETATKKRNTHPTLKPIGLTRHLATLLLPPEEYAPRRLFVPFAGTGSEMIGAFQAGWECVIGVELEKEYVNIGRARLKYWLEQGIQLDLL